MKNYLRGTFWQLVKAASFLGMTSGFSTLAATFSVSPSVISNTYPGMVTLSISGLTNGETVEVRKYADVNTNGVIDAADWPIQQFSLTDGYIPVIGGMTNFNMPFDWTPTDGAITSQLNLQIQGIAQQFVGKCLYRLSSPGGHFAPITNLFTVTNYSYAQSFTGTVRSSGTNVPNAGVLLFTPDPSGEGLGMPVAGTVANNSGSYSLKAPPGTYVVWAFQNGYVADLTTSPVLTLGAGATITANLNLVPGTRTISGRVVDAANNSVGLPGILAAWNSANGQLSVQFSDANGNFTASATAGQWQFGGDDAPFALLGYLTLDDWPGVDTSAGNVSGVTIPVPKGTALLYGSVKDDQGQPVAGVGLNGINNNWSGPYTASATTDQDGRYVMAVNAGLWGIEVDNESAAYTSYIFSPPRSANFTFANGQAVQQKFTALLATNHISGWVRQTNGAPIGGLGMWAQADIAGKTYQTWVRTDAAGNYALPAANGSWMVGLNCYDGDDSLQNFGNYQCPENQTVTIANDDAVAQFTVRPPEALQITTTSLPDGTKDEFYSEQLTAAGGQPTYHWYLPGGTISLPPGTMNLSDAGVLSGTPTTAGTYDFWVGVGNYDWSAVTTQLLSLTINASTTDAQSYYVVKTKAFRQFDAANVGPDTNGWPFIATLGIMQSSLGAVPVANATLPTSVVKAFPAGNSALELRVREYFSDEAAFNAVYPVGNYTFTLFGSHDGLKSPVLNLPAPTYPNAPRLSNFGPAQSVNPAQSFLLQWDAFSGGTANDSIWVVITDAVDQPVFSTPNPALDRSGALNGTATSVSIPAGTFQLGQTYQGRLHFFKILSVDTTQYPGAAGVVMATTTTAFPLATLSASPTLSQPTKPSASEFQFLVQGLAGQNYTIEGSSNLVDWNAIRATNSPTGTFSVLLTRATNHHGFYRVRLGP